MDQIKQDVLDHSYAEGLKEGMKYIGKESPLDADTPTINKDAYLRGVLDGQKEFVFRDFPDAFESFVCWSPYWVIRNKENDLTLGEGHSTESAWENAAVTAGVKHILEGMNDEIKTHSKTVALIDKLRDVFSSRETHSGEAEWLDDLSVAISNLCRVKADQEGLDIEPGEQDKGD